MNFNLKENKYDKYWYRFLINKLKGNIDLAKMIIDIKNKNIIKTIKNEYIERDFYNWLNWDLIMRLKPNEEFIPVSAAEVPELYKVLLHEKPVIHTLGE